MAMTVATKGGGSAAYVVKSPPGFVQHNKATTYEYDDSTTRRSSATTSAPPGPGPGHNNDDHCYRPLNGTLLLLRAAAAVAAFVGVALVASCRHGDWMEFGRYPEYRYLLGASAAACVYAAAQALRNFRRMRAGGAYGGPAGLVDFAGDQAVAYLLMTASAAALPITLRMRSAVINAFTDAMVAAISLGFVAFAALALSAMLSGFRISYAAAQAQQPYYY